MHQLEVVDVLRAVADGRITLGPRGGWSRDKLLDGEIVDCQLEKLDWYDLVDNHRLELPTITDRGRRTLAALGPGERFELPPMPSRRERRRHNWQH